MTGLRGACSSCLMALRTLLLPARHLGFSRRQVRDIDALRGEIDRIVFAITSANQQHSRYNPLPFHLRAIGADRLARALGIPHRIFGIPHYRPTDRFARNLLLEIEAQTEGAVTLTPEDTTVFTSTAQVARQFDALGFATRGGLTAPGEACPTTLVSRAIGDGDGGAEAQISPHTLALWRDFPEALVRMRRLYRDPLLDAQGSLTETRDYRVYVTAMSNPAVLAMKYNDVKAFIRPGRIVDEGCADGALLVPIARDFPDSDLLGIEITGEFLAQCRERVRRGDFGGTHTHFYQRNLFHDVFERGSIDTTICNSTLHELWSYGEGEETVRAYLRRKRAQCAPGGRIIIRDVVGPEDRLEPVLLRCNADDGEAEGPVEGLSTMARFERFAQDFQAAPFSYEVREVGGARLFALRLQDAVEFMTKKDYVHNWSSEMHEAFAFWSLSDWKSALRDAGFMVREGTRAYVNPWIVAHRWEGSVELLDPQTLAPRPCPVTTMVLVGEAGD